MIRLEDKFAWVNLLNYNKNLDQESPICMTCAQDLDPLLITSSEEGAQTSPFMQPQQDWTFVNMR